MNNFATCQAGVNLGGWLSQYSRYDHEHFKNFITAADIRQIADWGMDHVRLPVDYPVLEDDEDLFNYKESGLEYIDRCLEWCQENGLSVVLDLHHAPGFSFTTYQSQSLFADSLSQERFIRLWEMLTERYAGRDQPFLVFELLNEVVLPSSAPWNRLALRAVDCIRSFDPERWIMIGGNHYNSAPGLLELDWIEDERIVYTFHFYEPMPVTHQKAHWAAWLKDFDCAVEYPGKAAGLKGFLETHPEHAPAGSRYVDAVFNKELMRRDLQPALDFLANCPQRPPLYCGEFGVIDLASLPTRLNWHRDFIDLLQEYGIGRACWSYKLMNFALVDEHSQVVSAELVKIVSAR